MPNRSIIEYPGKRGTDLADQIPGRGRPAGEGDDRGERDGVTRKQAAAELRERLVRVERKPYRRPKPLTFAEYVHVWLQEGRYGVSSGSRARCSRSGPPSGHLSAFLGSQPLGAIRPRDVAAYTAEASERFAPKTIALHLNVLRDVFKTAMREELVDSNPVAGAERPKVPARRWRILEPAEVGRVLAAFTDEQARTVFLTLVLNGVRRFELQALRWRDVDLVESVLRVRESKSGRESAPSRSLPHSPRHSGSNGARQRSRAKTSSSSAIRHGARSSITSGSRGRSGRR